MQIPLDMAVDLNKALGLDAADNLQTLSNDGSLTLEHTQHELPPNATIGTRYTPLTFSCPIHGRIAPREVFFCVVHRFAT